MTTVTPSKTKKPDAIRDALTAQAVSNPMATPTGITASWEIITPEQAQAILDETNDINRRIRPPHVASLARDMANSDWHEAGDPIRFDSNGRLIDGQHRLSAVVLSGKTQRFLVMRGFAPVVQTVLDSGIGRTAGDALTFAGIANRYNIAAVARLAIHRDEGYYASTRDGRSRRRISHAEILQWFDSHPDVAEFAADAILTGRSIGARPSAAWVYGCYVLSKIDPVAYQEFNDSLYNAATGGAGDPRATLLQYFRKHGEGTVMLGNAASPTALLFVLFRTWNAWRDGEKLNRLVPAGRTPEKGAVVPDPH